MNNFEFKLTVKAPAGYSHGAILEALHSLIQVGQADASDSAEDNNLSEEAVADAVLASSLDVSIE